MFSHKDRNGSKGLHKGKIVNGRLGIKPKGTIQLENNGAPARSGLSSMMKDECTK